VATTISLRLFRYRREEKNLEEAKSEKSCSLPESLLQALRINEKYF